VEVVSFRRRHCSRKRCKSGQPTSSTAEYAPPRLPALALGPVFARPQRRVPLS
jgi:hypothetical protein